MTREEAIVEIERIKNHGWCRTEALDMAIAALNQQAENWLSSSKNGLRNGLSEASDLISRQAAIDVHCEICGDRGRCNGDICPDMEAFQLLPSAQSEIVRCKDCEHWDTTWQNDFAPNYHYCPLVDGTRRGDFYCADAERRGERDE